MLYLRRLCLVVVVLGPVAALPGVLVSSRAAAQTLGKRQVPQPKLDYVPGTRFSATARA